MFLSVKTLLFLDFLSSLTLESQAHFQRTRQRDRPNSIPSSLRCARIALIVHCVLDHAQRAGLHFGFGVSGGMHLSDCSCHGGKHQLKIDRFHSSNRRFLSDVHERWSNPSKEWRCM